jgi:hypothetical protein
MKRNVRGNMLVMSGVFMMVNAVALVVAGSYGSLYFVHNRLQNFAEEIALDGARKLNEQDRIGQMNNMIARSRQMVFDSDAANQESQSSLNHLTDLASQLYSEAREGALFLEQERLKLRNVSRTEATSVMTTRFNQIKDGQGLVLPWLQAASPGTPAFAFGCAANIKSNVNELSGIDALDSLDRAQTYITTDGSALYRDNIDARLTGAPADLSFKIASLSAPVQNSVSPARTSLAKSFRPVSQDQLYSTVQVTLQIDVNTAIGASSHSQMQATGTAEATGGQPML